MTEKREYLDFLPKKIRAALSSINPCYIDKIRELRFRVNRPLGVFLGGESRFLDAGGGLVFTPKSSAVIITAQDIREIFEAVCQYSVHSFSQELKSGFITIKGGHRIGICGTAVLGNKFETETIKHISGLSFRIARELKGCSDRIYDKVFYNRLSSVLIAGPPGSGKTTLLRDLCRRLGRKYKLSIIDERGEIAAVLNGIPLNDIGDNSDVFDGYSKPAGIETAIRVMSPQVIVCDEIGNAADTIALEQAAVCGVKIIASIHAEDMADIKKKNLNIALFDFIILLNNQGEIRDMIRIDNIENSGLHLNRYDNNDDRNLLFSGS